MALRIRSGECWRRTRTWGCPHHPDGPPDLPADGYEREELQLEQAYGSDPGVMDGFRLLWERFGVGDAGDRGGPEREALMAVGACCLRRGLRWRPGPFAKVSYCARGSLFAKLLDLHLAEHYRRVGFPDGSSILMSELLVEQHRDQIRQLDGVELRLPPPITGPHLNHLPE